VKTALSVLQVLLAVLVMLGVLLQTPKASGLGGTIGGSGDIGGGYRRRRGLERSLLRITAVLIGLFVLISAINTYVGSH
jgi:protein translocase SecG subunit